jgi:hypothetical protein
LQEQPYWGILISQLARSLGVSMLPSCRDFHGLPIGMILIDAYAIRYSRVVLESA